VNGFLQRLAGAVIAPQSSIHPLVGSRFLRPSHWVIEVEQGEETLVGAPRASAPAAAASAITRDELIAPSRDMRKENTEPLADGDATADLVRAGERKGNAAQRTLKEGRLLEARSDPRPSGSIAGARLAPHDDQTLVEAEATLAAPSRYRALLSTRSADSAASISRPPPVSRNRPYAPSNMIAGRAGPPAENDQVEIHIGRIEVVAPPASPRAAPLKPPRRAASSLDDYLARRDRRSS
jgi:hypothetical protein